MSEEAEVIQHLLEVEREAAGILKDAQIKADSRIAEARAASDARFKEEYAKIVKALDAKESEVKETILRDHENQLSSYKTKVQSSAKDFEAFNSLFETLLYA